MEGKNWFALVVLAVVVLLAALVRARSRGDGDGGESGGPDEGAPGGGRSSKAPPRSAVGGEAGPESEAEREDMAWPESESEERFEPETEVEPVPEPLPRPDNPGIRREAWRIFRAQYWRLVPVALTVALAGQIPSLAEALAQPYDELLARFLSLLFGALTLPLTSVGWAYAALRVWKGDAPRVGMLAEFMRPGRFFSALGLSMLNALLFLLPLLIWFGVALASQYRSIVPLATRTAPPFGLVVLVTLAMLALVVWLSLRIAINGYALARAPERGAMNAFRTGFRATGRRVGSVLGMYLSAGWPLLVIVSVQFLITFKKMPLAAPVTALIDILYLAFYGGYVMIAMAGLAENLLPPED